MLKAFAIVTVELAVSSELNQEGFPARNEQMYLGKIVM
jgi:hypothetical protein